MSGNQLQAQLMQQLHLPRLKSLQLIELALMHKSYINEAYVQQSQRKDELLNQHRRLAHLGDSMMNAAITDYLFQKFPHANQGVLTQKSQPLKARKGAVLYAQAVRLNCLCKMGVSVREQDKQGDMFGELFEALIGAIYLSSDRDFALTRDWFQTQCAGIIKQQLGEMS